ncbi:MAG: hypothetical protein ACFBQW_02325 [Sphingomonadaceae bacterium]
MTVISIVFMVVVVPVVLGIGYAAFEKLTDLKKAQLEALSEETAEKAAQYAAHSERLEERVRVLERIVTDKGFDIAGEIEDLRKEPLN